MTDDRTDRAVEAIAAHIVAQAADTDVTDSRSEYADIGEHDWNRIVDTVARIAPWPDAEAVDAAVEYLARRAQGQEATP